MIELGFVCEQSFVISILYILSFLLIWQFGGYQLLMLKIALRSKRGNAKDYGYTPSVSIILPVHNEKVVVKKRIDNLLNLNYPKGKYEIIVVESGSTDDTHQIVKKIIENRDELNPMMKLLREEKRKGKASAINLGKKQAKNNIILITDANSIFDKNVLKELMPHFKNPKIGAVGGKYIVSNPNAKLTFSESFYWDQEHIMCMGESAIESACALFGTMSAFRSNLINADTTIISEDLDMIIQVKRKGYKIKYEPDAIVYEPSATTKEDQIKRRVRTSTGRIQCIFKHWAYLLLPRDLYSLFIFPSHKTIPILSPFMLLLIPFLYLFIWDIKVIAVHFLLTISFFSIVFYLLIYLRSKLIESEKIKLSLSISSISKIIYYVLLIEYLILVAWKNFIFKKYSILWEKAESTRM